MNDKFDLNKLPKGMFLNNVEGKAEVETNSIKLEDVNYVKIISDKLKEIKELDIKIKSIDIKQEDKTELMLILELRKGVI